jgi:hypothetical protein
MNVEIRTEAAQFLEKEYINGIFVAVETREGWPLLTVETDVNGSSKSANERGPSLVGSLGLPCQYKKFLPCLGCSSRPRPSKIFFPSSYIPSSLSQTGQAVVQGRLSVSKCLCCGPIFYWS